MSPTTLTGLFLGLAFGGSLVFLGAAWMGWRPTLSTTPSGRPRRGAMLWGTAARRRAAIGIGVGLVVAIATRWPVAAIAAAALIYLWPTMFGGHKTAVGHVERLEALAVWTESLRDTIAGAIGLEQAIRSTTATAPPILRPALERLEGRMNVQTPLPEALAEFAEEFEDASADLVVAALILNSRLRGKGLGKTLSELATSAREEIEMRRRVEENRKALRRVATIILISTGAFALGVAVLSREYVAPYSTVLGQFVLALVLAIFAAGLVWIRAAAQARPPARFLVGVGEVGDALQVPMSIGGARR
ncbi:type II secretion system F family protein [Pimelobacter simplex]|uniref:type II secretion system F family protein n=1 Tax=Nocardioides simplex TaxID=2045 RepID=UPI002150257E|nr:type II secretion system F family protein [Pimelobacter simplex]UUW92485.1 type II secretion system F family protein [Pimelobacter simplex]UUW96313.1 type II secretion system F family protein [Pimelobacter simplex]